jgi:putative transposase
MQPCCERTALAIFRDDESFGCPPRSRLHWGERQQAAAVRELALDFGRGFESSSFMDDVSDPKGTRDWPHAPPHRLGQAGVYFLTARAAEERHLLADDSMKDWFEETLFTIASGYEWKLEAWAVLSNHYHFVAHIPEGPDEGERAASLRAGVRKLHSLTTKELNRRENKPGRTRLWQNFREKHLTRHESYLTRLNYVHRNAVHHGLVLQAVDWKWCSALKFKKAVSPAWLKTVASFQYDQIALIDGE